MTLEKSTLPIWIDTEGKLCIPSTSLTHNILSNLPGCTFLPATNHWTTSLHNYSVVFSSLRTKGVRYSPIPESLIIYLLSVSTTNFNFKLQSQVHKYLLPFQREAVNFALNRGGRVILADDMGLGKSIQALAVAEYYREEYPLLIISPCSLCDNWKQTVKKFLKEEAIVIRKMEDIQISKRNKKNLKCMQETEKETTEAYKDRGDASGSMKNMADPLDSLLKDLMEGEKILSQKKGRLDNGGNSGDNFDDKDDTSANSPIKIKAIEHEDFRSSISLSDFEFPSEFSNENEPNIKEENSIDDLEISDEDLLNEIKGFKNEDAKNEEIEMEERTPMIFIISYEIASRNIAYLENFKCVIADECHYLKSMTSQRTKRILPFLQKSNRLILVSGTPALSKPIELFPLFSAIDKKIFKYREYCARYCLINGGRFKNLNGCRFPSEISCLLSYLMIRRTKTKVLNDLPKKKRKQIEIEAAPVEEDDIIKMYQESAMNKIEGVLKFLRTFKCTKYLIFAHHDCMMSSIENFLIESGKRYIRIDGTVLSSKRQKLCDAFQAQENIQVALLSITAASTGLTLTSANTVVFAELYWNPGNLLQAEDRVHRIGQMREVEIIYLIGRKTVDERVWPKITKKLSVLEKLGVSENQLKKVEKNEEETLMRFVEK